MYINTIHSTYRANYMHKCVRTSYAEHMYVGCVQNAYHQHCVLYFSLIYTACLNAHAKCTTVTQELN